MMYSEAISLINKPRDAKTHIADLEEVMRGHFKKRFERKRSIRTKEDAHEVISIMEKARVFIVYPDSEFARTERDVARHVFEQLQGWYHAEK